jgi:hypothetical protein
MISFREAVRPLFRWTGNHSDPNSDVNHSGKIIERGTHESLLKQEGFYHHLYLSQFKGLLLPEAVG